jgi:hypothetical protein
MLWALVSALNLIHYIKFWGGVKIFSSLKYNLLPQFPYFTSLPVGPTTLLPSHPKSWILERPTAPIDRALLAGRPPRPQPQAAAAYVSASRSSKPAAPPARRRSLVHRHDLNAALRLTRRRRPKFVSVAIVVSSVTLASSCQTGATGLTTLRSLDVRHERRCGP